MPNSFKDHFGGHAAAYAAARPTYPEDLYTWIAQHTPRHDAVWDCATGNGQAAVGLAAHFKQVYATDGSKGQIDAASPHPQITFTTATAESCDLPAASVDAVTVAQAVHWFDHPRFYEEVRRVVRPGGLIACWGYSYNLVNPAVDALMARYHAKVDAHWPAGREHLIPDFPTIPWPFEPVEAPKMEMRLNWQVADLIAYLRTWSATKRFQADLTADPVTEFEVPLRKAWGIETREVRWPIHWRAGRV